MSGAVDARHHAGRATAGLLIALHSRRQRAAWAEGTTEGDSRLSAVGSMVHAVVRHPGGVLPGPAGPEPLMNQSPGGWFARNRSPRGRIGISDRPRQFGSQANTGRHTQEPDRKRSSSLRGLLRTCSRQRSRRYRVRRSDHRVWCFVSSVRPSPHNPPRRIRQHPSRRQHRHPSGTEPRGRPHRRGSL